MSTASSVSSTELDHYGRKVVWPCNNNHHLKTQHHGQMTSRSDHQQQKANLNKGGVVDKPMAWMKQMNGGEYPRDANEELEMDIQKKTFAVAHSNRLSRSRSRHIMERARSFERAAAEAAAGGSTGVVNAASGYNSNASSRPGSRAGSVSRNRRSPSVGRQLGILINISGVRSFYLKPNVINNIPIE